MIWPLIVIIFATIAVVEFTWLLRAWQWIVELEDQVSKANIVIAWHESMPLSHHPSKEIEP